MSHAHLLMEDDRDIVDLTKEDLETDGHQVTVAGTVTQGVLQAQEDRPDLIITDLGFLDSDGRDVVARVRQATTVPVIVLTARNVVWLKAGHQEVDLGRCAPSTAERILAGPH